MPAQQSIDVHTDRLAFYGTYVLILEVQCFGWEILTGGISFQLDE